MVIEFEQAVREPKLRQKYVERVDLEGFAQYVKRVKYISNKSRAYSKELYETCLMCTICPFDLILCGTNYLKSKIYVFESSFDSELIQQESDFTSALVDHEGKHATIL
nr:hypothetical protein [Nanoarchaeum sp.]